MNGHDYDDRNRNGGYADPPDGGSLAPSSSSMRNGSRRQYGQGGGRARGRDPRNPGPGPSSLDAHLSRNVGREKPSFRDDASGFYSTCSSKHVKSTDDYRSNHGRRPKAPKAKNSDVEAVDGPVNLEAYSTFSFFFAGPSQYPLLSGLQSLHPDRMRRPKKREVILTAVAFLVLGSIFRHWLDGGAAARARRAEMADMTRQRPVVKREGGTPPQTKEAGRAAVERERRRREEEYALFLHNDAEFQKR